MFDFKFYFPATGPFLSSGTVAEYKVTIILVMFAHILLDKDSKSIAYDTFYETGGTPCRKHRKGDGKPFVGTEWQLVQLNGRAVPVEGDLFTVVFGEDGRLSGLGACNRFMGSYQTTETGGLTVGQNMASTRMFCPDLDREQAFGDVLSGATHYEVDGDMLMLLTDGELRAVLQAR